jgi:hypothetical protein
MKMQATQYSGHMDEQATPVTSLRDLAIHHITIFIFLFLFFFFTLCAQLHYDSVFYALQTK